MHFQAKLNNSHKAVIKESPLVGLLKIERQLKQSFEKKYTLCLYLIILFWKNSKRSNTPFLV